MSLFDKVNVYGDLCTNHFQDLETAEFLIDQCNVNNIIPKIQLYNEQTWNMDWMYLLEDIPFVASVFKPQHVDLILPHEPLALKVASVESLYTDLLKACMDTGLPLIVSTGGMNEQDLEELLDVLTGYGDYPDDKICLMHCVSTYPNVPNDLNLRRIDWLTGFLDNYMIEYAVGWSSHLPYSSPYLRNAISIALALCANQIEIHVKAPSDRLLPTPDELCAVNTLALPILMNDLKWNDDMLGTGLPSGVDRENVLEWRKRWQELPHDLCEEELDNLDDEELLDE